MSYIKDFSSLDFLKFLAVGGFAAAINFLSRILLNYLVAFVYAVILAYLIGMAVAFFLSKVLVFKPKDGKTVKQGAYFFLVNILAVGQTLVVSVLLAEYIFPNMGFSFHPKEIAHLVGISMPIFTSFLGHKYFTFKK
jgi:putative flippase GtrA